MISITLPDGNIKAFESAVSGRDVALSISEGLARSSVAMELDGRLVDLETPIERDAAVRIVTTRWRAIPAMLPAQHVWFANSGDPKALADALAAAARAPSPEGALRSHYREHFTPERHIAELTAALRLLATP